MYNIAIYGTAGTLLESYKNIAITKLYMVNNDSKYIANLKISAFEGTYVDAVATEASKNVAFTDASFVATGKLIGNLKKVLAQPLETPFDCMFDAAYPVAIKEDLIKLFSEEHTLEQIVDDSTGTLVTRDDAFLYVTNLVKGASADMQTATDDDLEDLLVDVFEFEVFVLFIFVFNFVKEHLEKVAKKAIKNNEYTVDAPASYMELS